MKESSKDPVNMGGLGGWAKVGWLSEISAMPIGQATTKRSSRGGNEYIKLRKSEGGTAVEKMRRDLMAGENPRNRERDSKEHMLSMTISKHTTREKVKIQPPSSASAGVMV